METPIVVARCGRDKDLNILEPGRHQAEAIYLENQPEGSGWFIPPWCPECEVQMHRRLEDPEYRAPIDAYLTSPEFVKFMDHLEGLVAYEKIMRQEEEE